MGRITIIWAARPLICAGFVAVASISGLCAQPATRAGGFAPLTPRIFRFKARADGFMIRSAVAEDRATAGMQPERRRRAGAGWGGNTPQLQFFVQ
jgi:hypothetical protein